jgi:hypothetical protein
MGGVAHYSFRFTKENPEEDDEGCVQETLKILKRLGPCIGNPK